MSLHPFANPVHLSGHTIPGPSSRDSGFGFQREYEQPPAFALNPGLPTPHPYRNTPYRRHEAPPRQMENNNTFVFHSFAPTFSQESFQVWPASTPTSRSTPAASPIYCEITEEDLKAQPTWRKTIRVLKRKARRGYTRLCAALQPQPADGDGDCEGDVNIHPHQLEPQPRQTRRPSRISLPLFSIRTHSSNRQSEMSNFIHYPYPYEIPPHPYCQPPGVSQPDMQQHLVRPDTGLDLDSLPREKREKHGSCISLGSCGLGFGPVGYGFASGYDKSKIKFVFATREQGECEKEKEKQKEMEKRQGDREQDRDAEWGKEEKGQMR